MKFVRQLLLVPLALLAVFSAALAEPAAPAKIWRAGVETNSAPFSTIDAHGQPTGFSVELLRAVAQKQGLHLQYVVQDWGSLVAAFKAGELDVMCNVVDTPDRREFIEFSTSTMLMHGSLFTRKGLALSTVDDLKGRRLAVSKESRALDYARHRNWGVQYVYVASLAECLEAVHDGRADLLLASHLVAAQLIKATGYNDIVAAELQFPDFDYREHFGVQKGQRELLERLNEGLIGVVREGTYNQLYEKWLGPLEPRTLRWRDVQPYLPLFAVLAVIFLSVFLWQRRLLRRLAGQAQSIHENEQRLHLVFEGSQDAFWDWDVTSGRVMRSPRWAEMLGYTLEEIGAQRQSFLDLVHPDDQPAMLAQERAVWERQDHFSHEMRLRARDGEWKWILDRGKVVERDPVTGNPLRITGTHTDITQRKIKEEEAEKLQSKMLEAQKLESLGVLAGGIAHDFNNLLTVVLGNGSLARLDSADSPENAARLDSVLIAANRAAELCRQLLAYAGKGSYSIERVNLNELVTETTRLLELSISKQAKLEYNLAPALPKIEADPIQVRQIVMNLVINASEALENKPGVIRIGTSILSLPLPGPTTDPAMKQVIPGEYVCVEISDTGCGMKAEVIGRIFDPFFTTKFTGRGLGLAAVIGIVRTHSGTLTVASMPGLGSTFKVYLPVSSKQTTSPFENGIGEIVAG